MQIAAADKSLGTDPTRAEHWPVPRRQAWFAFVMAFLLMVFDFMDRQIVVAMFPALKAEWGLSDKELGALTAVVSITVAVFAFPIALLADRWSRVKSIAVMAAVWSLATIACGLSRSYGQLLAARAVIGLGEAGYGAAGGALLTSMFPAARRATVVGGFLAAAVVGSVLGVALGGVITARWGWQAAFGVVGLPGLVLAILFLLVRDYRTVPLTDPEARRLGVRGVLRGCWGRARPCSATPAAPCSFSPSRRSMSGCRAISTASMACRPTRRAWRRRWSWCWAASASCCGATSPTALATATRSAS